MRKSLILALIFVAVFVCPFSVDALAPMSFYAAESDIMHLASLVGILLHYNDSITQGSNFVQVSLVDLNTGKVDLQKADYPTYWHEYAGGVKVIKHSENTFGGIYCCAADIITFGMVWLLDLSLLLWGYSFQFSPRVL
jgi:hypothetical protein